MSAANISDDAIETFVKDMLKDPSVNIGLMPDAVESRVYVNMFKILVGILKKTCEDATINVMGHRIRFTVEPINEN